MFEILVPQIIIDHHCFYFSAFNEHDLIKTSQNQHILFGAESQGTNVLSDAKIYYNFFSKEN